MNTRITWFSRLFTPSVLSGQKLGVLVTTPRPQDWWITVLHILSGTASILAFFFLPFLEFSVTKKFDETLCQHASDKPECRPEEYTTKWFIYMKFPDNIIFSQMMQRNMSGTRNSSSSLMFLVGEAKQNIGRYQALIPINILCCVGMCFLDIIRRRNRSLKRDVRFTGLFGMSVLSYSTAAVYAIQMYIYFAILEFVSRLFNELNQMVQDAETSYKVSACLKPPKYYFLVTSLSVFVTVLNMTLMFDQMDPI